jgi:hypothetical protein
MQPASHLDAKATSHPTERKKEVLSRLNSLKNKTDSFKRIGCCVSPRALGLCLCSRNHQHKYKYVDQLRPDFFRQTKKANVNNVFARC